MVATLIYSAQREAYHMNNIYDAIKEKENQIAIFQAQISGLQAEIEALRVAARILEGGNAANAEAARPVAVQTNGSASGDKTKRVWP
jgi:cell division protein FtsL